MTTLVLETAPVAVHVTVTEDKLTVDLVDGRSLVVPLAWYPRLMQGSSAERQPWQLLGDGYAIEWPDLKEKFDAPILAYPNFRSWSIQMATSIERGGRHRG